MDLQERQITSSLLILSVTYQNSLILRPTFPWLKWDWYSVLDALNRIKDTNAHPPHMKKIFSFTHVRECEEKNHHFLRKLQWEQAAKHFSTQIARSCQWLCRELTSTCLSEPQISFCSVWGWLWLITLKCLNTRYMKIKSIFLIGCHER